MRDRITLRQVFEQAAAEAQRAHACGSCAHVREQSPTYQFCGAFSKTCTTARIEYPLFCPGYTRKPPPVPIKRVGLIRWLWSLFW